VSVDPDSAVVSGSIVGTHLILHTAGGTDIDAGVVVPTVPTPLDFMPVGFVYISVVATSPQAMFGGIWVRIGQGRTLVGLDGSQSEFDTVEETGGEKTHTLLLSEMPSHTHVIDHNHGVVDTATGGSHSHAVTRKTGTGSSTGVARGSATADTDGTTQSAAGHTHSVNLPAYSGASGSRGGDAAHNNLQPYLVVYMWKRTA
jgi:microcystin-dependent protein